MKESVGILFASGVLTFGGCNAPQHVDWEYETVAGTSDKVLQAPAVDGWEAIGISVTADGQKQFLLKRPKEAKVLAKWQFKTVIGRNDGILNSPTNQGWEIVGFSEMADSNKWYLLKKPKA
jgi:hypothetical protein